MEEAEVALADAKANYGGRSDEYRKALKERNAARKENENAKNSMNNAKDIVEHMEEQAEVFEDRRMLMAENEVLDEIYENDLTDEQRSDIERQIRAIVGMIDDMHSRQRAFTEEKTIYQRRRHDYERMGMQNMVVKMDRELVRIALEERKLSEERNMIYANVRRKYAPTPHLPSHRPTD